MIDRARVLPPLGLIAIAVIGISGCAPSGPSASSASPPAASAVAATPTTSPTEAPTPASSGGATLAGVPTVCYGLGQVDCQRVADQVETLLTASDPRVVYVQVGPFGCPDGERCPTILTARPEGDIIIEFAGAPAAGFHAKAVPGGQLEIDPEEVFGIILEPTTTQAVLAGAQPVSLGHCGLWSGIDLGGSWWDPVGPIDFDHGDAINAADGTIAFIDPDHATFTSKGGLTVQLQRRDGGKHLPFCD